MAATQQDLLKIKIKGVAKRLYDTVDVPFYQSLLRPRPKGVPGAPPTGVGSGAGDRQPGDPNSLGVGIYWPTPEPMLNAAIKVLKEVKTQKTKLFPPGRKWTPMGQEVDRNHYLELIVEKLREENQIDVDPMTEILCTNGISQGMFLIPMMLIDPGDEVLVMDPDYMRLRTAKFWGARMVSVPLKERKRVLDETRWYFDSAELESRITEKSKLFSFCNPNNPTGYVYSQDDLHAIARIAIKHDLFVLCNECYERMDFRDEFEHTLVFNSLAAIPGMQERTFTLQGCTKAYETEGNMTIGWLIGSSEHVSVLKWLQFVTCQKTGTAVGDYMGIAALTSPCREDYVRHQLKIYRHNRDLLWEMFNRFSWLECGKPKGGCFVFPDVRAAGVSDEELAKFLRERGIGAGSGTAWAENPAYGEGHMRFSYCSPTEYQKVMTTDLEEAFKEYEVIHSDRIIKN